nr:MAG TPA: hypothetical protein [Caudoviricetes sp.]
MTIQVLNQITLFALSVTILVQVLTLRLVLKKIDLVLTLIENACSNGGVTEAEIHIPAGCVDDEKRPETSNQSRQSSEEGADHFMHKSLGAGAMR